MTRGHAGKAAIRFSTRPADPTISVRHLRRAARDRAAYVGRSNEDLRVASQRQCDWSTISSVTDPVPAGEEKSRIAYQSKVSVNVETGPRKEIQLTVIVSQCFGGPALFRLYLSLTQHDLSAADPRFSVYHAPIKRIASYAV